MKHLICYLAILVLSFFFQWKFSIPIKPTIVSDFLVIFAIFFGFYITSFGGFSTSPYLKELYQRQDKNDNRKTLLDSLLETFKRATHFLLYSSIYLICVQIIISDKTLCFLHYATYLIWGVVLINFFYIFQTLSLFIKMTRQSAKG